MNTETVYLLTIGYKDYAFYDKKAALEAWDIMSKAYDYETDWKVDKAYVTNRCRVVLKAIEVYPEEDVKAERKALDEKEKTNE